MRTRNRHPRSPLRHLHAGFFGPVALFCLALTLVLPQTLCAALPATVRIGAFNFYPAIFRGDDGVIQGFYVDALAELARRENLQIEYVYGSWAEGLERIKNGDIDVLTSVAYTPARAAFLDYSQNPLLTVWGELYVPATSKIDNIVKVAGKTVAVMKNDYNGRAFIDMVDKFGISCNILEFGGFEDVFKAVAARQVDAGIVNSTFGIPKHKAYHLRSTGVVFAPFDIHFAVAKGKNRELLNLLDAYLERWRSGQDPTYVNARQHWAHGTLEKVPVVPRWLRVSVVALGLLTLAGATFILLLKRQVARATKTIVQRETSLRQNTEMTQLLINSTAEAIFGLDLDGVCIFCNTACIKLLGYERADQLVGKKLHPLIHYAHIDNRPLPYRSCAILRTQHSGAGVHVDDEVFWRADGTPFPAEYRAFPMRQDGRIIGSVVTFLDATERKKLEENYLFLSQRGYKNLSDTFLAELVQHLAESLDLDWVCINRLTGERQAVTPIATYKHGTEGSCVEYFLEGTPCSQTLDQSVCCYPRSVQTLFPQAHTLRELNAEGFVGATLYGSNGQAIGLIAATSTTPLENPELVKTIFKLVSLRTAGELERIDAKETLLQKNAEIERFTYAVSHDLKSPLVTIKTFLGYLQQDMAAGNAENVEKDMGFILTAADKMDLLLDELLRMSRVGRLDNPPTLVPFKPLIEDVLGSMAGAVKERGVTVTKPTEGATLYGDRMRLGEIWQNLIDNAIKYMGAQPAPRIEIGVIDRNAEPVFYVRDNGIGIEPSFGHKIFGMFEKIDTHTEGAGLGLALVKKIVELYNGRIWLESEGLGHGSCFFFTLPDACNRQGENPT